MKKHIVLFALAAFVFGGITSCKKDDDSENKPTTPTTPTVPATGKAGKGTGTIEVNSATDTMYAEEVVMPTLNLLGIYCSGTTHSLTIQTGDKGISTATKAYTIQGDYEKLPGTSQVILNYYDSKADKDYYAVGGSVSYIVSGAEKTVKFKDIVFKSEDNQSVTISFEVKLK